jgi:transcription initiation factor IIF auxiliary subunit
MNLTVAQDQKYEGKDSWEWSVWIEGSDDDLDQIQEVTYKLHPSFPKPLRTTDDRSTKFKLESEGWGVFPIKVKVLLKNKEVVKLKHDLKLFYPDGTACDE